VFRSIANFGGVGIVASWGIVGFVANRGLRSRPTDVAMQATPKFILAQRRRG